MEIEELHLPYELAGERVELLRREEMLGPVRLGAKHAIQVAHIRYFKIAARNHIYTFIQINIIEYRKYSSLPQRYYKRAK